jgi:hypothetical protein
VAELFDRLADGGAAAAVQLGRRGMRQVRAQVDEGEARLGQLLDHIAEM